MSLTRRVIVLAVVALVASVSLVLATSGTATAGIGTSPGVTQPSGTQYVTTKSAHDKAVDDCRARGGTWKEGPDPLNPGSRIGQCTWEECEPQMIRFGKYGFSYVKCTVHKSPVYMWG
jgi:hypothetical protein